MLRNFSIGNRFWFVLLLAALFIAGVVVAFYYNAKTLQGISVDRVQTLMLDGQKQKLQVATEAMAESLAVELEMVSGRDEQLRFIQAAVDPIRFEPDKSGYFFVYENTTVAALPTKKSLVGKDLSGARDVNGVPFVVELSRQAKGGGGFVEYVFDKPGSGDQPKLAFATMIPGTDFWIGTGVYIDNIEAAKKDISTSISTVVARNLWTIVGIVAGLFLLVLIPLSLVIIRSIVIPVSEVQTAVEHVADGDLDVSLNHEGRDEPAKLMQAMGRMVESLTAKAELAERIAERDLTGEVTLASQKDMLGKSLQKMTVNLRQLLGQVNEAAVQIAAGSGEVSDSSQSLSQGATEQASSLEEISSSVTQLGSQTRKNAESADQASRLASGQSEAATRGKADMDRMTDAMAEISDSSQAIAKIIKVIDEIAFQTNLLALNAAVEAARAGRHGKGFAVVAEEVRSLAGRSAKAAQETAELIEGAVASVENGSTIAGETAEALDRIVEGSGQMASLAQEIALASNEQAEGITQINEALQQIDQVTQQNTANAEETASAAEELSSQAAQLRHALALFRLDNASQRSLPQAAPGVPAVSGWGDDDDETISLDDDDFGRY